MKDINVKECWITESTDGNPYKRDFYFRDEDDKIYHFTNWFHVDCTDKDLLVIPDDEHKLIIDYKGVPDNINQIEGKSIKEMLEKWNSYIKPKLDDEKELTLYANKFFESLPEEERKISAGFAGSPLQWRIEILKNYSDDPLIGRYLTLHQVPYCNTHEIKKQHSSDGWDTGADQPLVKYNEDGEPMIRVKHEGHFGDIDSYSYESLSSLTNHHEMGE